MNLITNPYAMESQSEELTADDQLTAAINDVQEQVDADLKLNLVTMESRGEELTAAINVVQEKVDAALRNNQLIRPRVHTWLTRAAAVQAEATQLKYKAAAAAEISSSEVNSSSWIKGWYTCCSRNNAAAAAAAEISSTEVVNMVRVTNKLLDERRSLFSSSYPYYEQYRVYIDFSSRKATAERVMVALKKDEIRLVGLYGMPGVGKTMLVEALSQQAKQELLFDEVVMVSLSSQNQDLRTIQDNVAKGLDLILEENESDISRAESISQRLLEHTSVLVVLDNLWERVELEKLGISQRLLQDRNVLVVLDNLWERVELEKLGIPLGNTTNKKRCCYCKVVFTTRDENLCDEMETDEQIEVVGLSGEDSWNLFRQNAGDLSRSFVPFECTRTSSSPSDLNRVPLMATFARISRRSASSLCLEASLVPTLLLMVLLAVLSFRSGCLRSDLGVSPPRNPFFRPKSPQVFVPHQGSASIEELRCIHAFTSSTKTTREVRSECLFPPLFLLRS